MKQGDIVLVWGATGGIGGYAVQYVLNGGGTPVGVVSSPEQGGPAARHGLRGRHRPRGRGLPFWKDEHTQDESRVAALRQGRSARSSAKTPTSCSSTPAARRWARRSSSCKRGGTVVTCAATSGYMVEFDNRHFWMKLKRLIAIHFANYREAWEANRLIDQGRDPAAAVGGASARRRRRGRAARCTSNEHEGKIGVLCLAPREGPRHRRPRDARAKVGEDRITVFQAARMSPQVVRGPNDSEHSGEGYGGELTLGEPLLTEIDHVAIAVHDLDAAIDYYRDAFGATVEHREIVRLRRRRGGAAEGRRELHPAPDADHTRLAGREGLEKRGEGLHHVGYRVADCAVALQAVKAAGGKAIDEAPRPGSRGTTVAFVHPKGAFGTLIELVQEG